ncbi:MAG: hypothetical protein E7471_04960 [Ruminococcaceae bacterium]|nr:hypothetical protein [Oscillospiraceae bacterium]
MSLMERAAYLQGLADGLDLDWETKENRLMRALLDLVSEMAASIGDLEETAREVDGELDEIAEELISIEQEIGMDFGCDDDACDCECDCEDGYTYEVVCPTCGDHIEIDESLLEVGAINCPNCNEELEFELDGDDECDCGCCHGE